MRHPALFPIAALIAGLIMCGCGTTDRESQTSGGFGYGASQAADAQDGNAVISMARQVGIYNWAVTPDDRTVYIEDMHNQWYRADLMSTCIDLHFALRLGFTFEPNGDFDKFSDVIYHGANCPVASLTRVGGPPDDAHLNRTAENVPR